MSSKFELTISVDYVSDWGLYQALREFIQNGLDEEVQNPNNKFFFNYDENNQTLTLGNKCSVLNIDSLLLGVTTKNSDTHTIGQFGEGYKIATVVCLRTGHPVTFYNYGAREVWTTKLVKSRRFGGKLVPTFYVDKSFPWKSVPDNDLTIVIENINLQEYLDLQEQVLHFRTKPILSLDCDSYGRILLEDEFKGKVFVSGLYVCKNDRLNYGYDITPEYLQLDRDRQTVSDFNLMWTTSRMWTYHIQNPLFLPLFYSNNPSDVCYLDSMYTFQEHLPYVTAEFYNKFGEGAIPVSTQTELDKVKSLGGKPTVVSVPVANCLKSLYVEFLETHSPKQTCYDVLQKWFQTLKESVPVPEILVSQFQDILEEYEDVLKE